MNPKKWIGRDGGHWSLSAYTWPNDAQTTRGWLKLASGFKEAGDRLLQEMLDGRRGQIDLLVMPILYLYRHWIELSAKAAVRDLRRFAGDSTPVKANHDLQIWDEMIRLAEAAAQEPLLELRKASALVRRLRELDPNGMAFRYTETPSGDGAAWQGPDWINLEAFAIGINEIDGALSYVVDGLLHQIDEMQQELYRMM